MKTPRRSPGSPRTPHRLPATAPGRRRARPSITGKGGVFAAIEHDGWSAPRRSRSRQFAGSAIALAEIGPARRLAARFRTFEGPSM